MATVSMASSLPTNLTPLKLRRSNRSIAGVAFASLSQDTTSFGVKITEGAGNLPKVVLTSTHGSEAETYLFGGCVTSWKVPSGKDLLLVRPDAVFNGKKPISGGIPHCFPQFGPGAIQQHGFARNMNWSVLDSDTIEGNPVVTLELKDSRSMWDFSFQALYKVILNSKSLSTVLTVTNTDKKSFSFNTALHTYFSASVTGASVIGLLGCRTLNKDPDPKNPLERKEESWTDAVLWNPHLTMEACYKDFVCVENAKIGDVQLQPDQSWVAEQHLSIA
ncbi:hypothetical protein MKX01_038347 [Papaver californicum]|nr:hypothetical protein MKX01_038347 [Papaver californicum]